MIPDGVVPIQGQNADNSGFARPTPQRSERYNNTQFALGVRWASTLYQVARRSADRA